MVESLSIIRKQYRDIDWMVRYPQQFHSKNPRTLMNMMSESDRKIFPFDVRAINWKECIEDYVYGVRKYLGKQSDSPEALLKGRKRILRFIHEIFICRRKNLF
jgi:Male sterility protein